MKRVLVLALIVALGASASAFICPPPDPINERTSIADLIGDGGTELIIGPCEDIIVNAGVDHDGPYTLTLAGGNFTCTDVSQGYKFPDNNTGSAAKINVLDGTLDLAAIESFGFERLCTIEIGANGTMLVGTQYAAVTVNDGNRYNIGNMILEGSLYASSGLDLVVVDGLDGSVAITAVPEPATMALLGLGGLLLRRKK